MQELESGTPDATYLNHVLQDKKTLTELLQRYRMDENQLDYTISYEEKLESSPKVKQKFYPSDKRVNG